MQERLQNKVYYIGFLKLDLYENHKTNKNKQIYVYSLQNFKQPPSGLNPSRVNIIIVFAI